MSKRTLVIPKTTYYYDGLPVGHACLEVPTPPRLPIVQYMDMVKIISYALLALHNTYEAFCTLSSPEQSWPPSWEYGRFERDEDGCIRLSPAQPHIIGEAEPHIIGGAKVYADDGQILRISSWRYGSPTRIELIGLTGPIELIGKAIKYLVDFKHNKRIQIIEEEKAKRDLALKEYGVWEKYFDLIVKAQELESLLLPPPPPSLEILTGKTKLYLEE